MSILSPILITLLVCVIYAWAFQVWPPGWGPLAAFFVIMLLAGAGVVYYMKKFADDEEREQLNMVTFLPSGVAIFFALLMTMAWWLSPLRAGATRLAAMHSAQPVEVALADADPTVRKHACIELVRMGAQKTSLKLYDNFNAHPTDAEACVEDVNKRGVGDGRYIARQLTRDWGKILRRMRREEEAGFVCEFAKPLGKVQQLSGMSEKGSPELLECALKGRFAKARACCAEAFIETYPDGVSSQGTEDLYVRGVDPYIFAKMTRVTFDAKDLDPSEATMGKQLALEGKQDQLISLGCDMFTSDRPDIRRGALAGMNHIAAQLSCARLGEENEGAMLHLAVESNWYGICDDMLAGEAKGKLTDRMCGALERSWEEAAFAEAQSKVLAALHRAQLKRLATTVDSSRQKRGYGVAGSKNARETAYDEMNRRLANGTSVFSLTRRDIRRASGQERNRDSCISFAKGNQNGGAENEFMDEQGIWCGRDTDSLDEIIARRNAAIDAVRGKGKLNVGDKALRGRYGDAAVEAAEKEMNETYEEGAKRSGK
jgi:hypothetical protein